jgi:hypothetical protein
MRSSRYMPAGSGPLEALIDERRRGEIAVTVQQY